MTTIITKKKYLPSFARRISRKLSPYQKQLLDELLPNFLFEKERFDSLIGTYQSARLEIGFGNGDHLIAQAERNPEILFIGCEPFLNGVVRVLDNIKESNLKNILIYPNDARLALEMLEKETLQAVYTLFPDPWPKNKQKKRRVINADTLTLIHKHLDKNGELIIATDHEDYAKQINALIKQIKLFAFKDEAYDIHKQPEGWIKTKYETKALAGRSHYFILKKSTFPSINL